MPSTSRFYIKFAQFEQRQWEMERAQAIFKLALDILPKGRIEVVLDSRPLDIARLCTEAPATTSIVPTSPSRSSTVIETPSKRPFPELLKSSSDWQVVINKRRFIYEDAISKNPRNYDVWRAS